MTVPGRTGSLEPQRPSQPAEELGRNTLTRKRPPSGPHGTANDPLVGQTIDGRYLVERVLGEGGMGVVYGARHTGIDRMVALKVLRSEFANDKEILDRFVVEAKTASALGNPHIVDILDFGRLPDGSMYFAMEHLDGISLTEAINQRLEPRRIAEIAIQVCNGLGAAHAKKIVHRDLKPDNIFILQRAGKDFIKLLDFGIAKVASDPSQKLTRAGAVFGTPHYMSPEQAVGTTVDHRADIYALGVILYEMASGRLPFDSDNFMGILTQHMYSVPVPIRALVNNADCPAGLEAIVQKCLEKLPGSRYQTVETLAEDLQLFLDGKVPKAVDELLGRSNRLAGGPPVDYFKNTSGMPIVPATPDKPKGRSPWIFVVVGLCVVAGGLAGVMIYQRGETQPAPTAQPAATAPPTTPPAVTAEATATQTVTPVTSTQATSTEPTTTAVASDAATAKVTAPVLVSTATTAKLGSTTKPPVTATATSKPTSSDPWDGPTKIFKDKK